jgi:hypothetical protein
MNFRTYCMCYNVRVRGNYFQTYGIVYVKVLSHYKRPKDRRGLEFFGTCQILSRVYILID